MKKQIRNSIIILITLLALLSGCADIMTPAGVEKTPAPGTGRVTIVIPKTGERTILPQTPELTKYVFSFEPLSPLQSNAPTINDVTVDVTGPAEKTVDIDLSPGTWVIKAKGLVTINGVAGITNGEYMAAEDQYAVNVFSGKSYTININLKAMQTAGKGVLAWDIIIPAAEIVSTATMNIWDLDGNALVGFTPVNVKTNPQGSIGLDTGFYLLDLYLDGKLQKREALHVYSGRTNLIEYTLNAVVLPAGLSGYFQTPLEQWFYDDGFAVDRDTKTFWYYMDSTMEFGWGGTIVHHIPNEGTANDPSILIIHVEDTPGDGWSNPLLTKPDIGKYFAYSYYNLALDPSGNMVSSAAAFQVGGSKNKGVDTITEAISEYTKANDYYGLAGVYIQHPVTAVTLSNIKGLWRMDADEDYIINIRGTVYTDWYEGDGDGSYDPWDWYSDDELTVMGDIAGYTGNGTSGILYIKVAMSEVYDIGDYIAVAWKNKSNGGIEFAYSADVEESLEDIQASYNDVEDDDQFPDFWEFVK
jgi:hypothetical protein